MDFDARELDREATHRILVGAVVPRPIAWVTSGLPPRPTNLAPFSSFTWVSQYPAMLGMTVALRAGNRKDTARNIVEDGEYVVNIADESMLEALHYSSKAYPPEISEVEVLGLATTESQVVRPRRLTAAPISMECRLTQILKFGSTGAEFIVGEVVSFSVRDDLYSDGKIDSDALRPLGRLGGPRYSLLADVIEMPAVRDD